MKTQRRVAITGVGMVTPVGRDAASSWSNLLAGHSGIGPIRQFDASGFPVHIGAEVKGVWSSSFSLRDAAYTPDKLKLELQTPMPPETTFCDPRLLKFASRSNRFALAAAEEALADAGLRPSAEDSHRWGLSVGAGMLAVTFDELQAVHDFCSRDGEFKADGLLDPEFPADPVAFCRGQTNAGLSLLTRQFGITGYATAVHTACASGGQAVGTALKVIRRGLADVMLAGGYDSMLHPVGLSGFCLLGALSTDNDTPERASRPFDLTRNGFVLGEGAGFLVLEEWQAARARGAHIYAELAGEGNSLSSYRITDSHPSGDGPIQAIQQALADAGVPADSVDYVNAHGTSTMMNERSECAALRATMGAHLQNVAVSSTKSCMGHLISAAGAVEAGVCALAIRNSIAPVNANLVQPDPDCDVNIVRGESRPMSIRVALSNCFGFGGSNNCLLFRSPEDADGCVQRSAVGPSAATFEPAAAGPAALHAKRIQANSS